MPGCAFAILEDEVVDKAAVGFQGLRTDTGWAAADVSDGNLGDELLELGDLERRED